MDQQPNELPIDMRNTVISKADEQTMLEMVKKPKRVRKFKEDYIREVAQLRAEKMASNIRHYQNKCDIERLIAEKKEIAKGAFKLALFCAIICGTIGLIIGRSL